MVFWGTLADGRVMMRLRPKNGLLGGMTEFPSTDWRANLWTIAEARKQSPINGNWRQLEGMIHHSFSHFDVFFRLLDEICFRTIMDYLKKQVLKPTCAVLVPPSPCLK